MALDQIHDREPETMLFRFRCGGCNYGASRRIAPERCPMCGGSTWEYEPWPPYASLEQELRAAVVRDGGVSS